MLILLMLGPVFSLFFPLNLAEWPMTQTCDQYICRKSTTSTDLLSTCLTYSNYTSPGVSYGIYEAIGCKNHNLRYNFCSLDRLNVSDESTFDVQCSWPTLNYSVLYPGETPCWSDDGCIGGSCVDYVCVGQGYQASCDFTYQCEQGLRCVFDEVSNSSSCDYQLRPGQLGCSQDSDCVNSCGCDYDSVNDAGICRPYFSVKVGHPVLKCDNFTSLLCSSGQCMQVNSTTILCIKPSVSSSSPLLCEDPSDCTDKNGKFFTQCVCGFNKYRTSYCQPFPGDEVALEMIDMLKTWAKSKSILACSSDRRWDFNCMMKWEPKLYDKLRYRMLHYLNFTAIQKNEACVKDIFTYAYWDAKESTKITSFSEILKIGLVMLIAS